MSSSFSCFATEDVDGTLVGSSQPLGPTCKQRSSVMHKPQPCITANQYNPKNRVAPGMARLQVKSTSCTFDPIY